MSNYVAVVFESDVKAHAALRKLWDLDEAGDLTVHGAAVLRRDAMGYMQVASRHTDLGMRTAVGVGLGALLGLLAGPVGVAAGIATGSVIGLTADALTENRRENAAYESLFTLKHGQSALVAEVSEFGSGMLDDAMKPFGGTIYRRPCNSVSNAAFGPNYYNDYLNPYYVEPSYL